MKIYYNKEFNCYETCEENKTDKITLDGVELKPVNHAAWKKVKISENNEVVDRYAYECTYCKVHFASVDDGYDYCPHCNAKMDLSANSAE